MKLGVMLGVGIFGLLAGLANFWFGDATLGMGLMGVFAAMAGVSAWQGRMDYDARPRGEPVAE